MMSHWHILGAGSMGSVAAWRLQQAGGKTTLLHPHPESYERQLIMPDGQRHHYQLDKDQQDSITHLILAVKATDTVAALTPYLPRLTKDATLIRLQNGMGTLEQLQLPQDLTIIHAVTTDGAWREDEVIHLVSENDTYIGSGQPLPPSSVLAMSQYWQGWEWVEDIHHRQWQKLAINAVINPLTAIHRCRNGALLDEGTRQNQMKQLADEIDYALPHWLANWPGKTYELACKVAKQTALNTSSMLADIQAQRRTEIEFINGYLIQQSNAHQISLPYHQKIFSQLDRATSALGK